MYDRTRFEFTVAGVAVGDTGHAHGAFHQLRYYPDAIDTGQVATVSLAVIPGSGDTGKGFDIYSEASLDVGAGFTRFPRSHASGVNGGPDTGGVPAAMVAGDKLRLKVTPADTGVAFSGKLWIWTKRH